MLIMHYYAFIYVSIEDIHDRDLILFNQIRTSIQIHIIRKLLGFLLYQYTNS